MKYLSIVQLIASLIVYLCLSTGCSQRATLDKTYANSFRAIFVVQGQARSKTMSPITADDAKAILSRRKSKGSKKGGTASRTSNKLSEAQDISSIFSM